VKKAIILIILIIACSVFLYFFQREKQPSVAVLSSGPRTVFLGDKQFSLEIAATRAERERGLSDRKSLCLGCAMLFVFDKKGTYPFWMKGMQFDLDILWVDDTRIMQIDRNISHLAGVAEVRSPKIAVDRVLEINAGESDRLGLKEGDKAIFK
jgi:hypothetical protein